MYIVCWQTEGRTRQGGRKIEQHYKVYDSEEQAFKVFDDLLIADADNGVENVYVAEVVDLNLSDEGN
ncbi:uncharacterized protein METZ01_LOCUS189412 [marine metagenome]|uniref:WGR domain-containing protein n=1 Tax=marine metagenome TaxID=408172 RepID=A0A382DDT3_9ZZZZ